MFRAVCEDPEWARAELDRRGVPFAHDASAEQLAGLLESGWRAS